MIFFFFLDGSYIYDLMDWSKVFSLINHGGLGVRKMNTFNQVLQGNWFWRFGEESDHF